MALSTVFAFDEKYFKYNSRFFQKIFRAAEKAPPSPTVLAGGDVVVALFIR
jgi:hypothetical protein